MFYFTATSNYNKVIRLKFITEKYILTQINITIKIAILNNIKTVVSSICIANKLGEYSFLPIFCPRI